MKPLFRNHPLVDVHRWINRDFHCEEDTFPAKTARTAIRWLEENWKVRPFFLWVDFFDPHEPWDPPEYLVKRYHPNYEETPMLHPNYGLSSDYTPEELKNLWAHYAAESELVDRYVGKVLQKIDDLQLWDETLVVVTSDHGTSVGEHQRTGKSNINTRDDRYWPIYPEIGHVPFLIAGGDVKRGRSLNILAQPIDILPTLCELADTSVDPKQEFQGRSFAKTLQNGESIHRKYAVCGSHIRANEVPRKATTPLLVKEHWGYTPIGAEGKPELYDLAKDLLGENDVSDGNEAVVKELHGLFDRHMRAHGASNEFISLWQRALYHTL